MVTLKRTFNNSHLRCALTLILSLFVYRSPNSQLGYPQALILLLSDENSLIWVCVVHSSSTSSILKLASSFGSPSCSTVKIMTLVPGGHRPCSLAILRISAINLSSCCSGKNYNNKVNKTSLFKSFEWTYFRRRAPCNR